MPPPDDGPDPDPGDPYLGDPDPVIPPVDSPTLPNTGSGINDDGRRPLPEIMLVGGAAALLAARKLRPGDQRPAP